MPKVNLRIIQGDILDAGTDALVNPANNHLRHGGGLARVIADAATAEAWQREQDEHPLIATGDAGWTSAGRLADRGFHGIVHAVGPVWGGGGFHEPMLLAAAHRSAMRVAYAKHCHSIAFPAISCGIFGYPVGKAALTALQSVRSGMMPWPMDVTFVLFSDEHMAAYTHAAGALGLTF